jgi:hypothetical protein
MRLLAEGAFTSVQESTISSNDHNLRIAPTVMSERGTVELQIRRPGYVTVDVVNALGERVAELAREVAPMAATRILPINATDLPQGTYIVRARVDGQLFSLPFVITR